MPLPTITAIEAALLAKTKGVLGNSIRGVKSLPGDWDDEMLKRFLASVPGAFVAFAGGARNGDAGATEAAIEGRWVVYVCTGHASGEEARRVGDKQQVGAYEMLCLLAPALHGFTVQGHGSFSLLDMVNLFTGSIEKQGLAVYAMTLSMPMTFEAVAAEALLAPFETFTAQLDVPPLTPDRHPAWLAGDYSQSAPDARDTVTLPQPPSNP